MSKEIKEKSETEAFRDNLIIMKEQFLMVLPDDVRIEKFIRVLQTLVTVSPNLLRVNRQSLYNAAMESAKMGLLPDGKEAAIVPFKQHAQFIPMVGGLIKKAYQSGIVSNLLARIVYKEDSFAYEIDNSGEKLMHSPVLFRKGEEEKLGVYAMAKLKDGTICVEVLDNLEIQKIKKISLSRSGPWHGPFEDEMWKKSAIKRLAKRLPGMFIDAFEDEYEQEPAIEAETVTRRDEPSHVIEQLKQKELEALPRAAEEEDNE